ncbi:MAG: hypothetical protein K0R26_2145 [Bacteroidota bacterium]|jgi:hypothetical protein|nr:hypothetical protein [Bacteroidota bacterium]
MVINEHQNISFIREKFQQSYQNLKLEFFLRPGQMDGPASASNQTAPTILSCRTVFNDGEITITPQTTPYVLEQDFQKLFGFGVVVFKKKEGAWVDTYHHRNLTLRELNQLKLNS